MPKNTITKCGMSQLDNWVVLVKRIPARNSAVAYATPSGIEHVILPRELVWWPDVVTTKR
jgi:hypothetical protein